MSNKLRILIVEDLDTDAEILIHFLKRENIDFVYERVWHEDDYIKALHAFEPDLIISDHSIPGFGGMEAFRILKGTKKNVPFILITGTVSEILLTRYMKEGLDDYILKENLLRLPSAIENVLNKKKIENLHAELLVSTQALKTHAEQLETFKEESLQSLRYAQGLQNALMQEKEELKEVLPQSFIFYSPKQIVSGDFFWFSTVNDGILIAAGDCTGHGVPGALLTIMGMNILHAAVILHKINSPALLLKYLDQDLNRKLSHKLTGSRRNDGMDITICEINRKEMMLTVSGVNNPVYLIRNGELLQFKTDKYNIGAGEINKEFDTLKTPLIKGDMLYMFSDGFADQFGGDDGKKFSSARFRELLIFLSNEQIENQENLLRTTLEQWQGKEEQTDDILVLGIKI